MAGLNSHCLAGRRVLDDSGTYGVAGAYAASAGACVVVLVDSDFERRKVAQLVAANHLCARMSVFLAIEEGNEDDDVQSSIGGKFDYLFSLWLREFPFWSRLSRCLNLRRRYVKETGLVVPSSVTLTICAWSDPKGKEDAVDHWAKPVADLDLSALRLRALREPDTRWPNEWARPLSPPLAEPLLTLDTLDADSPSSLTHWTQFALRINEEGPLHALLFSSTCLFPTANRGEIIALTTAPEHKDNVFPTSSSLRPVVIYLDKVYQVAYGDLIEGENQKGQD